MRVLRTGPATGPWIGVLYTRDEKATEDLLQIRAEMRLLMYVVVRLRGPQTLGRLLIEGGSWWRLRET